MLHFLNRGNSIITPAQPAPPALDLEKGQPRQAVAPALLRRALLCSLPIVSLLCIKSTWRGSQCWALFCLHRHTVAAAAKTHT